MCAVSLRGQDRFKFKNNYNGYCWDGQTTKIAIASSGLNFQRLVYKKCKIDFVGAAFVNKKRSVPIGYFHDEAVYGVEMVEDEEPLIVEVPVADVPLPDSRTSFPVSKLDWSK